MSSRHSAALGAPPALLVLNRFDDEFGEYHRFVDPTLYRLFCISTRTGSAVLDRGCYVDIAVTEDLEPETVAPIAHRMSNDAGGFVGIAGLSEFDLLTAARLRADLRVTGHSSDFVTRFRDKAIMKEMVAKAGVRVPRFRSSLGAGHPTPKDITTEFELPVVLKPRTGAASRGVYVATTTAELEATLRQVTAADYECEEYIGGDIFHVDGIRRGGAFHFVSASAYVNTCLALAYGTPLGSVLLDPSPLRDKLIAECTRCLDALGLDDGPFHLELFVTPDDELVFLEVGMRPGGGEIPFLHRELFGIDLMGEAFRASVGLDPLTPPASVRRPAGGGFVMIPEPAPSPSRVLDRSPLLGMIPEVYREVIPEVGEVFDGEGGYGHIGGRFRLRGSGEDHVRRAIAEVMTRYELRVEPADQSTRMP